MAVTSDKDINWEVTQGDTWSLNLTYTEPDGITVIDLTGYSVVMQVRDKPDGKILCADLSIGNGITIDNPQSGIMDIIVTPEQTKKFVFPRSAYQILGTDQYGQTVTFLQGWFTVDVGVVA
jgi:hypothetical protein